MWLSNPRTPTLPCRFYHYDPTKWLIAGLALLGQATGLKRFSDNEVRKAELQMKHEELRKRMQRLDWGPKASALLGPLAAAVD